MPALIAWWTRDLAALAPEADPEAVAAAGADLLARWRQPHRRYHGTRHLVEMFWALGDLGDAGELDAPEAVVARVAAWFHDAVYDPSAVAGANEAASAALAEQVLAPLRVRGTDVEAVVGLVRMTADHVAGSDPLQRAFHDADLWILAAREDRFEDYCRQVRQEYASVPDGLFRSARSAILTGLVDADGLYLTALGRREWEGRARANLERELARLRSDPPS